MTSLKPHGRLPAGVYVHIPFCIRKCHYCDFYSTTDLALVPEYLSALEREIQMADAGDLEFDSIYLGGGTPSVLTPEQIDRIMAALFGRFRFRTDLEVNIEVNPGTADRDKLAAYRAAGLNRITLGVQSFSDRNLAFLGRIHSAEQAERTIGWAREAGFDHLGLDLIYGLPDQTRRDWVTDLSKAVRFRPEHLSCYLLTVEQGTPLHEQVRCGRVRTTDEKTAAALFTTTLEFLSDSGYRQYEVSNFALADGAGGIANRSRHNQKYWNFAPYLGFGPGAHSYREPRRHWNHRSLQRYLTAIGAGGSPRSGFEELSREQMMIEAIFLGLRQTDGIDLTAFRDRFGIDFREIFSGLLEDLTAAGQAGVQDDRLALTPSGLILLDSICAGLVQVLED